MTSCYECSLDMLTPQTAFPICTIANTPRLPEHCIEWASVLEWPRQFGGARMSPPSPGRRSPRRPDKKIDGDDPDHIQWLYDLASARAEKYNIAGVTWSLTQGVVKNIIPAIASTNAIIAGEPVASTVIFRRLTPRQRAAATRPSSWPRLRLQPWTTTCELPIPDDCEHELDVPLRMYTGNDSIYTYTFQHQRKPDCPVCGQESVAVSFNASDTLQDVVDHLIETPNL